MTQIGQRPGTAIMDPNAQKSDYVRQLEAAASAISNSGIQYVKFQKGWWLLGRDATPFPNNTFYFMPNLQTITYGWQCWRNSQCIEDRWYSAGERVPDKSALPDHGPYSKDNDGWQKSVKLEMVLLPDQSAPVQEAVMGLFVSSSAGGLNAVSKLLREFATGLKTGRTASDQIIVQAFTGTYIHKQYGPTPFPEFNVTQWLDEASAYQVLEGFGVSLPPVQLATTPAQVQHQPAPAPAAPRHFGGGAPQVQQPAYAPPSPQPAAPVYAAPQPAPTPPWEGPSTIPPQQAQPVAAAPVAPAAPRTFGNAPQAAPPVQQPAAPPVRRFVAAGAPPAAPVAPVQAPAPAQPPVQYAAPPAPAPVAAPAPAPVAPAPPPAQAAPAPAQAVAGAPPVARRGHPRRPPAAAPSPGADAPPVAGAAVDAALADGSV